MPKKFKYLIFVFVFLAIFLAVFQKTLATHLKVFFLLTQEFPQIKIKPLGWVTPQPQQQTVELENLNGHPVVVDMFSPGQKRYPAVILTMGVKTAEKDKPVILGFAQTLARLGYVVAWPRLKILDEGVSQMEEPETFLTIFEYLERHPQVLPQRISFIGFSVGSSIAMVAAQDSQIAEKVHGFVFFGGYYDLFDYLVSLESKIASFGGEEITWEPAEGATSHLQEILENVDPQREKLEKLNPAKNINNFQARIFILHERSDSYVPYLESAKLNQALEGRVPKTYLLVNLFEHVQPAKKVSFEVLGEFLKLYRFITGILEFL